MIVGPIVSVDNVTAFKRMLGILGY